MRKDAEWTEATELLEGTLTVDEYALKQLQVRSRALGMSTCGGKQRLPVLPWARTRKGIQHLLNTRTKTIPSTCHSAWSRSR